MVYRLHKGLYEYGAQGSRVPDSAQVPFEVDKVAACWFIPRATLAANGGDSGPPGLRVRSWRGQFFVEFLYLSGYGVGVVFVSE